MDTARQSPALVRLFETYTAAPDSIGAQLTAAAAARTTDDPLIAATSTDLVLYPGRGREPEVEGFRFSALGFKEITGVSHLGPATASLLKLRLLDPQGTAWREQAQRLIDSAAAARAANSVALWRDVIAVPAYRGREARIAALVDYACALTERYLARALAAPETFTPEDLRRHYLEATGDAAGATVPMNAVMIATFFLVGMDTGHRVIAWFDRHAIDWSRAMVVVAGQQGRPTAGVTVGTNSVCAMILAASRGRLPLDRLYVAPHAPGFSSRLAPLDMAVVKAQEAPLRRIWSHTRVTAELGPLMLADYPRFAPAGAVRPTLEPGTESVPEMPAIAHPEDWRAFNTRLRVVLEDPRQLLSGCVLDYAVQQLQAVGNDPARVRVPGLDGIDYPAP